MVNYLSKFLPHQVKELIANAIGKKCSDTLIERFDIKNAACTNLALSKAIGFVIVLGASLVKVPQILKIWASKSGEGLSLSSYLLETIAYSIALAYNYRSNNPFSTYGETAFVTAQNILVIVMMLYFSRRGLQLAIIVTSLAAMNYALHDVAFVTTSQLTLLQTATIPISIMSKIPQIWTNFTQKSTGQLSFITVFLFFAGSVARIYTTMTEIKGDNVLLAGFVLGSVLNGILMVQMVWYWENTPVKTVPVLKKKKV